jgi:hypothetical protein
MYTDQRGCQTLRQVSDLYYVTYLFCFITYHLAGKFPCRNGNIYLLHGGLLLVQCTGVTFACALFSFSLTFTSKSHLWAAVLVNFISILYVNMSVTISSQGYLPLDR